MIRAGPVRSLLRPLASSASSSAPKRFVNTGLLRHSNGPLNQSLRSGGRLEPLALTAYRPCLALVRHYAAVPGTTRNPEKEAKFAKKLLVAEPHAVSTTSSIAPVIGPGKEDEDPDMLAGMRHDIAVIKETFALDQVPKEALNIGLAGVLPYLATSVSTIFCAVEIHQANTTGTGYLLNAETAEAVLQILEPLQVGYGAVILSFLGAIHWGLEWAKYGGAQGYRRYAIGVIAPAVAWPTILMPVEHALITQFLAFSFLYSIDSTVAGKGWVPPWYATYRFVLTFIVGASIVASLIGRGQIADRVGGMPTPTQRIMALRKPVVEGGAEEEEAAEEE